MIIGISMGQEICLIIGQVSFSSYCKRNYQTDIYVVRGETDKKAANIYLWPELDEIGKKCPFEGEAKVVT